MQAYDSSLSNETNETLRARLKALGLIDESIGSLLVAYRAEHLRDPATIGDILEVVE